MCIILSVFLHYKHLSRQNILEVMHRAEESLSVVSKQHSGHSEYAVITLNCYGLFSKPPTWRVRTSASVGREHTPGKVICLPPALHLNLTLNTKRFQNTQNSLEDGSNNDTSHHFIVYVVLKLYI